jgi:drug/metabolite transporter (DMT)-like permease
MRDEKKAGEVIVKVLARLSFLLITVLWGSFYAVTKEALGHIDPIIFTLFEILILVPIALSLILIHWRELDRSLLRRGSILGSWLCLAMLIMTIAERFTSATNTAFFSSVGGVVAALITGIVLRRRISWPVWVAGICALLGTLIILLMSGGRLELRGNLIAFLGAILFTVYIFLVDYDRQGHSAERGKNIFWLVLGIEQLTMASWITLVALLFGDWQHTHPVFPKDLEVIVYIAAATTFVPLVLATFMQKYIEPLEVAFISILEPVWGALIAHLYLGEIPPLPVYLGGCLVIAGSLFHTLNTSGIFPSHGEDIPMPLFLIRQSLASFSIRSVGLPALGFCGGVLFLKWLGGFPPSSWLNLYRLWPSVPYLLSQGQSTFILRLCLQSLCWAIAWGALITIGILTAFTSAHQALLLTTTRAAHRDLTTRPLTARGIGYISGERRRTTARTLTTNDLIRQRLRARWRRLGHLG